MFKYLTLKGIKIHLKGNYIFIQRVLNYPIYREPTYQQHQRRRQHCGKKNLMFGTDGGKRGTQLSSDRLLLFVCSFPTPNHLLSLE